MLARVLDWVGPVSMSVFSQVGVLSKRMNESSWSLAWAAFHQSYTVLKENSSIWNLVPNSSFFLLQYIGMTKYRKGPQRSITG